MENLPTFKKLQSRDLPSGKSQKRTQEGIFWKGFGDAKLTKEVSEVDGHLPDLQLLRPSDWLLPMETREWTTCLFLSSFCAISFPVIWSAPVPELDGNPCGFGAGRGGHTC